MNVNAYNVVDCLLKFMESSQKIQDLQQETNRLMQARIELLEIKLAGLAEQVGSETWRTK